MILQLHDTSTIHHDNNFIKKKKKTTKQAKFKINHSEHFNLLHTLQHALRSLFLSYGFNLLVKGTSYLMPIIIEAI